jgi:hypothetical protein
MIIFAFILMAAPCWAAPDVSSPEKVTIDLFAYRNLVNIEEPAPVPPAKPGLSGDR